MKVVLFWLFHWWREVFEPPVIRLALILFLTGMSFPPNSQSAEAPDPVKGSCEQKESSNTFSGYSANMLDIPECIKTFVYKDRCDPVANTTYAYDDFKEYVAIALYSELRENVPKPENLSKALYPDLDDPKATKDKVLEREVLQGKIAKYYDRYYEKYKLADDGTEKWHKSALKATAMAIKTFALYRMIIEGYIVKGFSGCGQAYHIDSWNKLTTKQQAVYRDIVNDIWKYTMKVGRATSPHGVFHIAFKAGCTANLVADKDGYKLPDKPLDYCIEQPNDDPEAPRKFAQLGQVEAQAAAVGNPANPANPTEDWQAILKSVYNGVYYDKDKKKLVEEPVSIYEHIPSEELKLSDVTVIDGVVNARLRTVTKDKKDKNGVFLTTVSGEVSGGCKGKLKSFEDITTPIDVEKKEYRTYKYAQVAWSFCSGQSVGFTGNIPTAYLEPLLPIEIPIEKFLKWYQTHDGLKVLGYPKNVEYNPTSCPTPCEGGFLPCSKAIISIDSNPWPWTDPEYDITIRQDFEKGHLLWSQTAPEKIVFITEKGDLRQYDSADARSFKTYSFSYSSGQRRATRDSSNSCSITISPAADPSITFDIASGSLYAKTLFNAASVLVDGKSTSFVPKDEGIAFNIYESTGTTVETFSQPVKLDIRDANGQEIYVGCFPFKDVCTQRWYTKPVMELWKKGVIEGNATATFRTYKDATRAEFITAVVRAANGGVTPAASSAPFSDVQQKDWFAGAVEYAKQKGWISVCKDSKTQFCPNDPISNAEAMEILTLAFKQQINDKIAMCQSGKIIGFKDVSPTSRYAPYACAARQANITDGFAGHQLRPEQPMSRAFMAKAICVAAYGVSECIESGDENLPMVLDVTPRKATVGQSVTLSVDGFKLPMPSVTMTLLGCDNLSPLSGGTENKQQFTCTPSKAGNLTGQVKDAMGTVLHEFPLNVATAATQGTPVPNTTIPTNPPNTTTPTTEPGGAAENPSDESKLFLDSSTNSVVNSCTFKDVVQTAWYAESVNKLCGAGILVGYWEGTERVFVKLDPGLSNDARSDVLKNSSVRANVAETLKVFLLGVDYQNISLEMKSNTGEWYDLFINEATTRGLNLYGLSHNSTVTRKQAMTWLAKLFYNHTGSDPIGFLQGEGLVTTDPTAVRADALLNRYELAYLAYRTMLKTGKDKEINFGLRGEPAFKPQPPLGDEIVAKAVASVGKLYPYTDGKYTYCARFVRMMFDKQAIWGDAKSMCNHYANMMQTSQTPPAGAVLCYAPNASNYNYGHVAIAVGDGTEVGATSLKNGVTKRNSVYGSAYQGWIDATTFSNNYPQ